MSQAPRRDRSFRLPRLSRTSVSMPVVVSADENPSGRKRSEDVIDVSPLTSQARLSIIMPAEGFEEEEDGDITPMALDMRPQDNYDASAFRAQPQRDMSPESKKSKRNDSTSTSAIGPAGSGMPPAETAFLCEKEVVDGVNKKDDQDDLDDEDEMLEMRRPDTHVQRTFLNLQPEGSPRHVQSPRPKSNVTDLPSLDASSMAVNDAVSTASKLARLGSKFESSSTLNTADSRQSLPEEDANIMLSTAQKARLKRPSLIDHPGASSSSIQARSISDARNPPIVQRFIPRSKTVATSSATREASALLAVPGAAISGAQGVEIAADLLYSEHGQDDRPFVPPNTLARSSAEEIQKYSQPLTLIDALRINPGSTGALPKRSTTVPASLGARRKPRFTLLPLSSNPPGTFRREDIIATPYPVGEPEPRGPKDRLNIRAQRQTPQDKDLEKGSLRFNLVISARGRTSTTSFSASNRGTYGHSTHSNSRQNDDENLFRTARGEYANLIGKVRHAIGAKTAKAVRLRFVRSNKIDLLTEPDTPTVNGRLGSYAESDCWRLWSDSSYGRKKREWLDMLAQNTKTYGASRHYVFEIKEGYDAARIIIAVSVITALSLIAMFLWFFLGAGGEGNALIVVDGNTFQPSNSVQGSSGRAGDAFIFGIWILSVGWSAIGGWILAS